MRECESNKTNMSIKYLRFFLRTESYLFDYIECVPFANEGDGSLGEGTFAECADEHITVSRVQLALECVVKVLQCSGRVVSLIGFVALKSRRLITYI